jgi:ATP-binding cassette subfamily F protein 3
MLLSVQDASFSYGAEIILKNINLQINENDRVGLIGRNGAGKTTLLKLIMRELLPDTGEITIKQNLITGYLRQNEGLDSGNTVYAEMESVFREVLSAVKRQEELSLLLSRTPHNTPEYRNLVSEYDKNSVFLAAKDGYHIDVKIKTVLNGMGFADSYNQSIRTMSGGEKTRLAIAKLLLEAPELLIFDEPTNHLDFRTLAWLEGYLSSYKGALVVVSHDRFFLDRMVDKIWDLEDGSVETYNGNYSSYKVQKSERIAYRLKEYEKQQTKIASMEDYIARNIVRATTANSAKSRVHQLANMERLEKPRLTQKTPHFDFPIEYESNKLVLSVSHLSLAAEGKMLLEDVSFEIKKKERIALIGANGTGKSTLMKRLAGSADDPAVRFGKDVKRGYYDQENLNLNFDNSVLEELWKRHHRESQTYIRSILGGLLLTEEDIDKAVGVLSGGERAKLGLAVVMADRCNTLFLDEPTNHLDLPTREALEDALRRYQGTVLFVSHDRYFINRVATAVLELDNRAMTRYEGNFDLYERQKRESQPKEPMSAEDKPAQKKNSSYRSAKERADEVKARLRRAELEKTISSFETEIAVLDDMMLKPEILSDYARYKLLETERTEKQKKLDSLYEEWIRIQEPA